MVGIFRKFGPQFSSLNPIARSARSGTPLTRKPQRPASPPLALPSPFRPRLRAAQPSGRLGAPAGIRSAPTGSSTAKAERLPLVPTQPVSAFAANQPPRACCVRASLRGARLPPATSPAGCSASFVPHYAEPPATHHSNPPPRNAHQSTALRSLHRELDSSRSATPTRRSTPTLVPPFGDSLCSGYTARLPLPHGSGRYAMPVRIGFRCSSTPQCRMPASTLRESLSSGPWELAHNVALCRIPRRIPSGRRRRLMST